MNGISLRPLSDSVEAGYTYRKRLLANLSNSLRRSPQIAFADLLHRMRGATPDVVLQHDGVPRSNNNARTPMSIVDNELTSLEAHPLDYDWQFTSTTVAWLTEEVAASSKSVGAFGAPSIIPSLQNCGVKVQLFDRNPVRLNLQQTLPTDFRRPPYPSERIIDCAAAVFDAPWYQNDLLQWISRISRQAPSASEMFFSLWPELTRPSAGAERDRIVSVLSRFGTLDILNGVLEYKVPLFEQLAMSERGVSLSSPWRRGDLVRFSIEGRHRDALNEALDQLIAPSSSASVWARFVIGRRQIAIRLPSIRGHHKIMLPLPDQPHWHLTSVSRRDIRRSNVDIWSSNNVVGRLEDPSIIIQSLGAYFVQQLAWSSLTIEQQTVLENLVELGFLDSLNRPQRGMMWHHQD